MTNKELLEVIDRAGPLASEISDIFEKCADPTSDSIIAMALFIAAHAPSDCCIERVTDAIKGYAKTFYRINVGVH